MQEMNIKSFDDRVVITFDKNIIDKDSLIKFITRLRAAELIRKADFSEELLKLADEIKSEWWDKNKKEFLKNTKYEGHS